MLKLRVAVSIVLFLLPYIFINFLFSAEELTPFKEQAQIYREQGLQFQNSGRLDQALSCYQKAVALDPGLIVAYNDLGIIYEAMGNLDEAERIYLAGLNKNPSYPNFYSNLAMLCEQKGQYQRAAAFWQKRIQLGKPDDAWTQRARQRLAAISSGSRPDYQPEKARQAILEPPVGAQIKEADYLSEARRLFRQAEQLYQGAQYTEALRSISLSLSFNPKDEEARLLRNKINAKLIAQERELIISK